MKNELAISSIVILALLAMTFQFVSAFSDDDISDFEFIINYNSSFGDYGPMEIYDYTSPYENYKFKVQITRFNEEKELDSRIERRVKESAGSRALNENIVFMDKNERYLFWRSRNNYIQIIAFKTDMLPAEALRQTNEPGGHAYYPVPLVEQYLNEYPSDCNLDNCLSKEALSEKQLQEDLKWFLNPPEDVISSNDYGAYSSCPIDEEDWEDVYNSAYLTEEEINEIIEYCEGHNKYTDNEGHRMSQELKKCWDDLNYYVTEKDDKQFDIEVTLDECLLREKFIKEHEDYDKEYLSSIFNERNKKVLREIEFFQANFGSEGTSKIIYRNQSFAKVEQGASEEGVENIEYNNDSPVNEKGDNLIEKFSNGGEKMYLNGHKEAKSKSSIPLLNDFFEKIRIVISSLFD